MFSLKSLFRMFLGSLDETLSDFLRPALKRTLRLSPGARSALMRRGWTASHISRLAKDLPEIVAEEVAEEVAAIIMAKVGKSVDKSQG